MNKNQSTMEKWVWTELLAFDVRQPDLGVKAYMDTAGMVPDVISLLISSPDVVLLHEKFDPDAVLPPDFCSRDGHAGNEVRRRQVWTSAQLKELIGLLQQAGSKVFLSNFTHYLQDKFHHEWLTDHREALQVYALRGRVNAINALSRLKDGSYFQDHFAKRLVRLCEDYGFDGWQGADGWAPLSGPVYLMDCSDDMIAQFVQSGQRDLPEVVLRPSEDKPDRLTARLDWIWRNRRLEWLGFWTDRWADFWRTIAKGMHAIGRQVVVNSAYTRDPFEGIYRFGVDYRKLVDAGVDGIVVETCASSMSLMDANRDFHYDHLAMVMQYKAYLPDTKLICFVLTKDVLEDWDVLRHCPAALEREAYSTSNVYHINRKGAIERDAGAYFFCLGDGLSSEEWRWLRRLCDQSQHELPRRVRGATLVWSDEALHGLVAEFPEKRTWSLHRWTQEMMQRNGPVQATVNVADIDHVDGLLLVINPHLFPDEQRRGLLKSGKPVMTVGADVGDWPAPAMEFVDSVGVSPMRCRLYNAECDFSYTPNPTISTVGTAMPDDPRSIVEPKYFREVLKYRPISDGFLDACASLIRKLNAPFSLDTEFVPDQMNDPAIVGITMVDQSPGVLRMSIRNTTNGYSRPRIDLGRAIESVKVITSFPVTTVFPEGSRFHLVVPPRGIVVVDVRFVDQPGENEGNR